MAAMVDAVVTAAGDTAAIRGRPMWIVRAG